MNLLPTSLNRPELTFMYTLLDYFRARLWPCYIYFAQKISWIVNWFGEDHFYLSLVHNSFPAYFTHDFHRGRGKIGGSSQVRVRSIGSQVKTGYF